jgi:prepilin-type N-terminal cleavage/methylation domain-containing protein
MICRNRRGLHRPGVRRSSGFTLIEVLVATAITGIALGVLLSGIGMGHSQAFRGDMKRTAAHIAERVLRQAMQNPWELSDESGDVEEYPGWSYSIELRDLTVNVKVPVRDQDFRRNNDQNDQEERQIELPECKALILRVNPPDDAPPFVLTSIVASEEQSGTIQSMQQSDTMPSNGQSGFDRLKRQSGVNQSERRSDTVPFNKR